MQLAAGGAAASSTRARSGGHPAGRGGPGHACPKAVLATACCTATDSAPHQRRDQAADAEALTAGGARRARRRTSSCRKLPCRHMLPHVALPGTANCDGDLVPFSSITTDVGEASPLARRVGSTEVSFLAGKVGGRWNADATALVQGRPPGNKGAHGGAPAHRVPASERTWQPLHSTDHQPQPLAPPVCTAWTAAALGRRILLFVDAPVSATQ